MQSRTAPTSDRDAPFQLMPDLAAWEFDALKESIRRHGVLVPVIKDEHGIIIDGHHRSRACRELRLRNVPTITLAGLTEEQKRDHSLLLNLVRRKVTRKQLRAVVAAELRRTPELSNRWLAEILGTTGRTVRSVRNDLVAGGEIPHLTSFRGRDGKSYRTAKVYTERARQTERAGAALRSLGEDAPRRPLSLKQVERAAKAKSRLAGAAGAYRTPDADAPVRLHHADFGELEAAAGIGPGSLDLILTDVPYGGGFLDRFGDLAEFAARTLRDGGVFAAYVGVVQLARAVAELSRRLEYRATAFSSWRGDGPVLQQVQCVTQGVPLLILSKGDWNRTTRWYNAFHNERAEQELHPWQKPLADVEHWLLSFSDPGDLVCDPCAGSGTTAVACLRNGRRFVGGDVDLEAVGVAQERLRREGPPRPAADLSLGRPGRPGAQELSA
ncbi:DNA methyltransferase [Alienimonas sp. DA493]|uniref:DNA methyltransferase n=1 Tax=Alienimonas sp. DA493 TaxID=3373605 RepID=UPI003755008A